MTERVISQDKDVCIAVLVELDQKSFNPEDLADKLWEEMKSPVATAPVVHTVLNFFERKELVTNRRGKYAITNEGRRAIGIFFQNNPHLSSIYGL